MKKYFKKHSQYRWILINLMTLLVSVSIFSIMYSSGELKEYFFLSLFIIAGYIFMGTLIFNALEKTFAKNRKTYIESKNNTFNSDMNKLVETLLLNNVYVSNKTIDKMFLLSKNFKKKFSKKIDAKQCDNEIGYILVNLTTKFENNFIENNLTSEKVMLKLFKSALSQYSLEKNKRYSLNKNNYLRKISKMLIKENVKWNKKNFVYKFINKNFK